MCRLLCTSTRTCAKPSGLCHVQRVRARSDARDHGRRSAGPWGVRIRQGAHAARCRPTPAFQQACWRARSTRGRAARSPPRSPSRLSPVPAFTFPQSGRDNAKLVFISKLHSKGTGESISGALLCASCLQGRAKRPWPSVLIWVSAMSSGTGAVQLQPRLFKWATRRCKQ